MPATKSPQNFTGPCIEWEKSKNAEGYGYTYCEGKVRKAHRVAYAKRHGLSMQQIEGLVVRHKCDNPGCVNPDHLELGTNQDNVDDMLSRGRHVASKGERNGRAKLTKQQVEEIRARYVRGSKRAGGPSALAREFGVGVTAIKDIVTNKHWKE